MRNILIAAACMSAFGAVQAQSGVTVYGVVDQYLDFSRNGDNSAARIQSGGLSGSRLGFKGEEALGGGLKALFTVEAGFDADTGASGQGGILFGRQSYVGLGGNFGQLTVGRQYSMYSETMANYGLGSGQAWGNANNYFNEGSILRVNNSIKYQSPSMSGLVLKAMYALGENAAPGQRSVGNLGSLSGQYDGGGFSLGLSYSTRQSAVDNREAWAALGTYYDFGPIKTGLLVTDVRDDIGVNRNRMYELSAEIPLPSSSLLLDVGRFRNRAFDQADATSYSVRYDYFLSKRTTLYTGAALIRNGRNAMFTIGGATGSGLAGPAGGSARSLIAGLRHIF
jgi:predicted porin